MNPSKFTGVRAKWLPLYKKLKGMAEQAVGPFEERETSRAILWQYHSVFTELSAKKDGLVVALASDTVHNEWEPAKTLQTSKNRVAHYFEVIDDSRFPQLIERIKASYALTQDGKPNKPRREPTEKVAYSTIEEYIALFPQDVREILENVRRTIHEAAPNAVEKISYQMPTFYQRENLIHFAAAKNHIGIYPGASGVAVFQDKLSAYKTSKGAIQLPFTKPIPYDLIAEITRFRVREAEGKVK